MAATFWTIFGIWILCNALLVVWLIPPIRKDKDQ